MARIEERSGRRAARWVVPVCLLVLLLGPTRPARAALSTGLVEGGDATYLEIRGVGEGRGRVTVLRQDRPVLSRTVGRERPVTLGPVSGRILTATYTIRFEPEDAEFGLRQEDRVSVEGTLDDETVVRDDLLGILDDLRQIYLTLAQHGEFLTANIDRVRAARPADEVPDAYARSFRRSWEAVSEVVRTRAAEVRADLEAYRDAWFLQPYPRVVERIDLMLGAVEPWRGDVALAIGRGLTGSEEPDLEARRTGFLELAENAHLGLDERPRGWEWPLDLAGREVGRIDRETRTYRSDLGFRVTWPEGWGTAYGLTRPSQRLRIQPSEEARRQVRCSVVVHDFPGTDSVDALVERVEVDLGWERYGNHAYRRIRGERTDDGYRLAYRFTQQGRTWRADARYVFRGTERVIGVVSRAPADRFDEFTDAFEAIAGSLELTEETDDGR